MDLGIKSKVALVTGASSGIGEATAKMLLKEGCSVIVCSRNMDRLRKAYLEFQELQTKSRLFLLECDVHKKNACESLIETSHRKLGKIDILVNNSEGAGFSWDFRTLSEDDWQKALNGKLMSYIRMIRLVLPQMEEAQWGRIINIAGLAGREPSIPLARSGVVNAGIINLTKTVSKQSAHLNVLINTINPGIVKTSRFESFLQVYARRLGQDIVSAEETLAQKPDISRLGIADEIANLIVFLASDLSSYITGSTISVDGGLSVTSF